MWWFDSLTWHVKMYMLLNYLSIRSALVSINWHLLLIGHMKIIISNFCQEALFRNYQPSLSSDGNQTSVKFHKWLGRTCKSKWKEVLLCFKIHSVLHACQHLLGRAVQDTSCWRVVQNQLLNSLASPSKYEMQLWCPAQEGTFPFVPTAVICFMKLCQK